MFAVFINNQLLIKSLRHDLLSDTERNLNDALVAAPLVINGGEDEDVSPLVVGIA